MAADDAGFSLELRGYKRDEVDQAVQQLRRELIKANTDKAETAKEVKRLTATVEDLQAELDETGSPTYAGLGMKLESTLRIAEEQSTRLISQADIDAERLRSQTHAEVLKLRTDAVAAAEKVVRDAQEDATRTGRHRARRGARHHFCSTGCRGSHHARRAARGGGHPRRGCHRIRGGSRHGQA